LAFAAALLAVSGSAAARSPAIVQHIAPGAFAYVPATITGSAPLIVVLHGAGGDARYFLDQFKHDADRRGAILLSVQSSGRTWAQRKPKDDEADVANIKAAIAELAKAPIDRGRTTVMGFSDGASYALSIGMAYPGLFRTIVAFSPGYAFARAGIAESQDWADALATGYEIPSALGQLFSPEALRLDTTPDATTQCFAILKDVSCDLETVKRRVALTKNSSLAIVNANAAIAFDAIRSGSAGFTGVFTNFHPDLYQWLMTEHASDPALADELAVYLALAAMAEPMGYPKLAKFYHQRLGTFACTDSRAVAFDIHEKFWALDALLDKIVAGTEHYRRRIAEASARYPAPISGTASSRSYR